MVDDDCSLETACIQVESFNHSNILIESPNFIKCCQKPNATFIIFYLQHHCIDPCTTGTCRAADFCRVSFHFDHYCQVSADNSFQITLDLSIFLEIDFNEVHLMLAISFQILPGVIRCFVIVTQKTLV